MKQPRPNAGEIVQHAESDRQHEAAETADHADKATNCTDVVRIIDRDMFEDRGFAEAHKEAKHEDDDGESDQLVSSRNGIGHRSRRSHNLWADRQRKVAAMPTRKVQYMTWRAPTLSEDARHRFGKSDAGTENAAATMPAVLRSRP